jgi:hypothetical protein
MMARHCKCDVSSVHTFIYSGMYLRSSHPTMINTRGSSRSHALKLKAIMMMQRDTRRRRRLRPDSASTSELCPFPVTHFF